jgi:hypothetical protein
VRRFYFETWPPPARIKVKGNDKCLDLDTASGNNLYMSTCHDQDNQLFYLVDDRSKGPTHDDVDLPVPCTSEVVRMSK